MTYRPAKLQAYHITGWKQFGNDVATQIDETQLAYSTDKALQQTIARLGGVNIHFVLEVEKA